MMHPGDAIFSSATCNDLHAVEVRVRGRVQGVGFRPAVWRIARGLRLAGEVLNDGDGVLLRVAGAPDRIGQLIDRIRLDAPPLARIDRIESRAYAGVLPADFRIVESARGAARTDVTPDAAICGACAAEVADPAARRYRYPFTNCTHCGPRLSIVTGIPYDRASTTMASFKLCKACEGEYHDPGDRRFHAEPIACPECGPVISLILLGSGNAVGCPDAIASAAQLIRGGAIVAIKGLGGYHLACDATNADTVARLRKAKRREGKPFALMARDLSMIRRYCHVDATEELALIGTAAPIILLRAHRADALPDDVAPGLDELGFMLPTTPLHLLLMQDCDQPVVMTSGNLSDEPPITDDAVARRRLLNIASHALTHDRAIANRVDDSVVRIMGGVPRLLRRARGFAPSTIRLPIGFETSPPLLAMGGELKAAFCLLRDGDAILSQHMGDLERASVFEDYRRNLELYLRLFQYAPSALVTDAHPEYLSSKLARELAAGLPVVEVQHHHAHVAACLAENGRALEAPPVLGIVLDGLGYGDDDTIWGGEFLLADYRTCRRLARLKPVAMLGGAQAVREPWRNLYAHLLAAGMNGRPACLQDRPLQMLDRMIGSGINAPLASSCGRLFDAVAAALGICPDRQVYEGEAAMRLEALANAAEEDDAAYPFALNNGPLCELDPAPMWYALLADIASSVPVSVIALRFHRGLAKAITDTALRIAGPADSVVLSGGCFQNRLLFEAVSRQLDSAGFAVLSHAQVPANDGGLALGQAAIGAARLAGG